MGPDTIWVFIPLTAIVLGIGSRVVLEIVQSSERRLQMKLQSKQGASGLTDDQMSMLRSEISQLRDTTTQHSISLQHSLERLEHRVEFLEHKSIAATDSARPDQPSPPPVMTQTTYEASVQQRVGRGG